MNASDTPKPDDAISAPEPTDPKDAHPGGEERQALPSLGKVNVEYKQSPPAPPAEKQIHPRRPMPVIPDAPAGDK